MTTTLIQAKCRNLLLRSMSADNFDVLTKAAELRDLKQYERLGGGDAPTDYVYFPETGIASVTSQDQPVRLEIGLIGYEGFVGIPLLLSGEGNTANVFVQKRGAFIQIPTEDFLDAVDSSRKLAQHLLRYVQAYIAQVASTAITNTNCGIEQRLARWLLMAHDRSETSELLLTHEMLSMMLGVRRPGVTVATHILEGKYAIKASRGRIQILNRQKLMDFSGACYGESEAEYERLFRISFATRSLA